MFINHDDFTPELLGFVSAAESAAREVSPL